MSPSGAQNGGTSGERPRSRRRKRPRRVGCRGRCAQGTLRPASGNVHSADGWDGVLKPVVVRYRGKLSRIYFRADAGFANPKVYEYLDAERIKYAIRLPANSVLQGRIGYLLTRPVGRPPNEVRCYYAISPIRPEAGGNHAG